MIITLFTKADSKRAAALHKQCFTHDPWPPEAFSALLDTGAEGFVASNNSETALGLILYRAAANEAEILTFCIAPSERRKRIGTNLLSHCEKALGSKNIASLLLEVAIDNDAALALYSKMGFVSVGVRSGYYIGTESPIDAAVMSKSLLSDSEG